MKITEKLLTPNKYSRPKIPLTKVTKIAVHYVGGAGSSAQNTRDYFESLKDQMVALERAGIPVCLQTLPDNYTAGVSDRQRYRQLENGWTADVIAHILGGLT